MSPDVLVGLTKSADVTELKQNAGTFWIDFNSWHSELELELTSAFVFAVSNLDFVLLCFPVGWIPHLCSQWTFIINQFLIGLKQFKFGCKHFVVFFIWFWVYQFWFHSQVWSGKFYPLSVTSYASPLTFDLSLLQRIVFSGLKLRIGCNRLVAYLLGLVFFFSFAFTARLKELCFKA